jgi:hypothetical protein
MTVSRLLMPAMHAQQGFGQQYGEEMANWHVGSVRLWVASSIAWVIGWSVFFIQLAAFEQPKPLDYLTIIGVTVGPPGVLGLIGWVMRGFRAKS